MRTLPDTPELDRLKAVRDESQPIGGFIDWLHSQEYRICELDRDSVEGGWYPIRSSVAKLLARYFKIDLDKVEEERASLLEVLRH